MLLQAPFGYSTTKAISIIDLCDWLEIKLKKETEYLLN